MRHLLAALFLGTLLCAMLLAQNTPPSSTAEPGAAQAQPATPAGQPASAPEATQPPTANQPTGNHASAPIKIAPGSVIPVQLAKTVEAKKAKTGDEVVATVTMDMKNSSGDILVPKDTRIVGHVTEAQARNKDQKESQLGIAFDHAVVKGDQMQLPMSIQAIIAPQTNNPAQEGGNDTGASAGAQPATSSGSAMGSGRAGSMGGSNPAPQQQQQNYPQGGAASASQPQTSAHPPITGNTQGVIGMPDLKLDNSTQAANQGSVVSSEKNNVKIEKGTMLLLRVNQ